MMATLEERLSGKTEAQKAKEALEEAALKGQKPESTETLTKKIAKEEKEDTSGSTLKDVVLKLSTAAPPVAALGMIAGWPAVGVGIGGFMAAYAIERKIRGKPITLTGLLGEAVIGAVFGATAVFGYGYLDNVATRSWVDNLWKTALINPGATSLSLLAYKSGQYIDQNIGWKNAYKMVREGRTKELVKDIYQKEIKPDYGKTLAKHTLVDAPITYLNVALITGGLYHVMFSFFSKLASRLVWGPDSYPKKLAKAQKEVEKEKAKAPMQLVPGGKAQDQYQVTPGKEYTQPYVQPAAYNRAA